MKVLNKIKQKVLIAVLLMAIVLVGGISATKAFANEQDVAQYGIVTFKAAKSKSEAMTIKDNYFGRAGAQISSKEASAFTSFGSNVVSAYVSATYRYKKATGGYGVIKKDNTAKMSVSISFSHKDAYSIISEHIASADNNQSAKKSIEILW